MVSIKDSESLYSPRVRDIERDYQLWSKAHKQIREGPAQDGRDYVKHARNLLPILEAFSELHPIAKAVVTGFKAIVLYEQERKENDARVAVVFVAQADTMGTLLDINRLAERRKERLENDGDDGLHAEVTLSDILLRIEKEVKACGNSMDTYYGEKRIVKFWKSQDWKERIMGHITKFDEYRVLLQQTLSVQVASDVNNLINKMDTLLLRLFSPKADWEKELATKTRQLSKLKDAKDLINDAVSLQTLVDLTRDPLLDSKDMKDMDEDRFPGAKADFKAALPTHIEQLKKDLSLSLDILCERNQEMFELKLNFHTQQLQEAILNSAHYVVRSLSGPYDRLHNEDLRILWKEMNWIFCVDNKLFTSALFEYFLDEFSSSRRASKPILNGSEDQFETLQQAEHVLDDNLTKVTFLSRMGVLDHVDTWTLESIAMYGERIALSIDRDGSGFIRISEANSFTDRMPEGWSLPQWCAYAAIGWTYEARIYRKRIHNILGKMLEMQAKVLPVNRGFVAIWTVPQIAPFFQLLAYEPWETTGGGKSETSPLPTAELRNLVHEKMKKEDEAWRNKLRSLNWTIEDESTLQLLYGKEPLETYVLQLSVLMLEYAYEVMQAGAKVTIDAKEISHLLAPLRLLKRLSLSRVDGLRAQFEKEKKSKKYLASFYGGIWYCIDKVTADDDSDDEDDENDEDGNVQDEDENAQNQNDSNAADNDNDTDDNTLHLPFDKTDIDDFDYDESVLEEFPLPPLPDGYLPYLKYKPWEEYVQSLSEEDIPGEIPNTWHLDAQEIVDEDDEDHGSRHDWAAFPLTFRNCNLCGKSPMKELYYACTVCNDYDICSECFKLPIEDEFSDHQFSHPVLRFALHTVTIHRDWMVLDAEFQIDRMRDDLSAIMLDQMIAHNGETDFSSDSDEVEDLQEAGEGGDDTGAEENDEGEEEINNNVKPDSDGSWIDEPEDQDEAVDNNDCEVTDNGSDVNAKDNDDQNPENDSESVKEEVKIESPYLCGRCQENIPLDSATTFYKCFRHSCRNYWLCEGCANQQIVDKDPDGHEWWHSLIVLRREILVDVPDKDDPDEKESESDAENAEQKKEETASQNTIIAAIGKRISVVEAKLDSTNSMLQDTLSSILEDKIQSTVAQLDNSASVANRALETRITQLEDKVDMMVMELRNFFSSFAPRAG